MVSVSPAFDTANVPVPALAVTVPIAFAPAGSGATMSTCISDPATAPAMPAASSGIKTVLELGAAAMSRRLSTYFSDVAAATQFDVGLQNVELAVRHGKRETGDGFGAIEHIPCVTCCSSNCGIHSH